MDNPIISPWGFLKKEEEVIEVGYYSTLTRYDSIKSRLTEEEFKKKWVEFCNSKEEDDRFYLENYSWYCSKRYGGDLKFEIEMDEWDAKHYADGSLAEFISQVIAEGTYCVLEFQGEDGAWWGYYITKDSVKEIKYVRMVDGKLIETT